MNFLSNNSNIIVPPQALTQADSRLSSIAFFCYLADGDAGKLNSAGMLRAPTNVPRFKDLTARFQAGFFPFVFDTRTPDRVYFGIGNDSVLKNGVPVEARLTCIRNGGHVQLARLCRDAGDGMPDVTGLYGGGFMLQADGSISIEFKSRGVNRTPGGELDQESQNALKTVISALFQRERLSFANVDASMLAPA